MTDIVEEMRDAMISTLLLVGKCLEDDDVLQLAKAAYTIVERRIGELTVKALSYDHAHEDAVEMGYPSLTEALEHLEELRK